MSHIKNLICRQGDFELNIPSLDWPDQEISALAGPSGSGKSTLALSLCGFKPVAKGFEWIYKGQNLSLLPPPERNISLLFQSLALFPHMNAKQNILFPAQARGLNQKALTERLSLLTEALKLSGFLKKQVSLLSGGERQRVALARALIIRGDFLILDEPFSSLNASLKKRATDLLKKVQAQDKNAVLLISHDEEEIKMLARRVFRLQKGRLLH